MQNYISTKIVKAEPHTGAHGVKGYTIIYPDGYKSWCPKEAFDTCYRLITEEEKSLINGST